MNTYYLDSKYFKYLVSELFLYWFEYSQEFFELLRDPDLIREICLHLPLPLVEKVAGKYITKPSFIRE